MFREARITRKTTETQIECTLNVVKDTSITTGIGFFDHMLTLLSFYSGLNLDLSVQGDLNIDNHHTVEDTGIVLGQALKKFLGDRMGINRYGTAYVPMDEALVRTSLDLSGRGVLVFKCPPLKERVGSFETECLKEFLYAFAIHSGTTLHIEVLYGDNSHHIIEGIFKSLGNALKTAIKVNQNHNQIPSTKGVLET